MKWRANWVMDGCQWNVEEIHIYEPSLPGNYDMFALPYTELMLFIYQILMPIWSSECYHPMVIHMHCIEQVYLLTFDDIKYIVNETHPEELV